MNPLELRSISTLMASWFPEGRGDAPAAEDAKGTEEVPLEHQQARKNSRRSHSKLSSLTESVDHIRPPRKPVGLDKHLESLALPWRTKKEGWGPGIRTWYSD